MVEENSSSFSKNCVLIQDILKYFDKQIYPCQITLTSNLFSYKFVETKGRADDEQYFNIPIETIIGCHCMRDKQFVRCTSLPISRRYSNGNVVSPENSTLTMASETGSPIAYICIYTYPLKKKLLSREPERVRKSILFMIDRYPNFMDNLKIAELWKNAIIRLVRRVNFNDVAVLGMPPPARKLLVLVNPHSGPGKALQIFQQRVTSVLAEADIAYQLIVTERANHAKDYIQEADLKSWNGIVIVSGDGLLFEVLNGLMQRRDWKNAIKTPIGIIPGGSGNGLARAIGHTLQEPYTKNAILCSSLTLVTGNVHPMDLIRVQTSSEVLYSFLSIGWGLLADIDIESEKLRALGEQRFTVWAVKRIINLRSYKGRVSFLPLRKSNFSEPTNSVNTDPSAYTNEHYHKTEGNFMFNENLHNSNSVSSRLSSVSEDASDAASALEECAFSGPVEIGCPAEEINQDLKIIDTEQEITSQLPPLDDPVPATWTVVEDDFLLVYVAYQTHISSDCFFAPQARLDDGIMWLVMIKKGASRAQILNFVLGMESGDHISCPFAETIPVQAVRIEPYTPGGYLTVDGEEVTYGPLQAEVLPSTARIMVH